MTRPGPTPAEREARRQLVEGIDSPDATVQDWMQKLSESAADDDEAYSELLKRALVKLQIHKYVQDH